MRDVTRRLIPASGIADMDRVAKIEMLDDRSRIGP
jgi:hypothetical protein